MTGKIAVDELRVGMFIHLDLSWMQHPFPVGSFRITHAQQIDKIRGLGLKQLRWSPEKSELAAAAPEADADDATPSRSTAIAPEPESKPFAIVGACISMKVASKAKTIIMPSIKMSTWRLYMAVTCQESL